MTTPTDDLSAYTELIPALKTRLLNLRREAFSEGWEAGYREGFEAGQRMFISVPANVEVEADIDGECHCWLCCGSKKDYEVA